ncbi:oxygen-independent coproporphyrinogen-3 oxidase [Lachnospiraceae bacterium XPB1003]|nr:oxygen-independent coproporphyrinogen-3 oxidase [Lachnospiraceae bacterium XPB1003]
MKCKEIFDRGIKFHHYCNTAYPLRPTSLAQYEIHDDREIYEAVKRNIESQEELCLYVHIPFCQARCRFCEYVVLDKPTENDPDNYVEHLLKEIEMYRKIIGDKPIAGYDLGGGTPSYLTTENLTKITDAIKRFNLKDNMYLSVETTPVIAANDIEKIKTLRKLGYNRISMGFQTVSEKLLESLGREGSSFIYEKAVANVREAGFDRLNIDLMYGFLNQSDDDFANTIKYTIALKPEFITLYRNRYKGTKLEAESQGVTLYKVNRQYDIAYRLLKEAGYIANNGKNTFSKIPDDMGTSSYLTKRVIDATSYVGFGLGAQSFVGNYLAYNLGCADHKLEKYFEAIDAGKLPINDIADMPIDEVRAKAISVMFYFGFISMKAYKRRFNEDFKDVYNVQIRFLEENSLMEFVDEDTFMLTDYGAAHLYGIIPLFYSERSIKEMFAMSDRWLNDKKGEDIYLEKYDRKAFDSPSVAVDLLVFNKDKSKILMINRADHPYVNKLALPGGFYQPTDVTTEYAASRELLEETSLSVNITEDDLVKVTSAKDRDPRGWIISIAYMVTIDEALVKPVANTDALYASWVEVSSLEADELAFDHYEIIKYALRKGKKSSYGI